MRSEDDPTRSRGEPAVRSCSVLCWVYCVLLCSTVATGTVVVKGVSREQQVWILDLVSVLIYGNGLLSELSTRFCEVSARK